MGAYVNNANVKTILETLEALPHRVKLVAVTKYVDIKATNEIIATGVTRIAENRIEVAMGKIPELLPCEKHFIGQIQSNKLRRIVSDFDVIQSVGEIEHLQKINAMAKAIGKKINVFLQFNISNEKQKNGFLKNDLPAIINIVPNIDYISIIGVMGMASQTDNHDTIRNQFHDLKIIRDTFKKKFPNIQELSMGMSNDYKIALEEGSTMVRIGSFLFH